MNQIKIDQGRPMQNSTSTVETHSIVKVIIWTLLFQLAWNWGRIVPVMTSGQLVGTDDFLRLHQIQNWMAGQGWYDISVHRMFPPNGADIHWSRLVDVPIAGLIWLFDLVFETKIAIRITTILWPSALLAAVVVVLTLICDRLFKNYNRLLPMLFAVLCMSSIVQFLPGRIDHHNVQILLFSLTILGLVNRDTGWGDYLMGFAMAFSISIGLDSAALFVIILAYLGYEWAIGHDINGRGLIKIALAIAVSTIVLFLLNFEPARYLDARCDANSIFYATALMLLSGAFILLALTSGVLNRFVSRALVGSLAGIAAIAILLVLFPDCANGPYGAISDEAKVRWLEKVGEAMSLSDLLKKDPSSWIRTVGYVLVMLIAGLYVVLHPKHSSAKLVALYVILLACALGTILQIRVLRTGIYVSIPFCVIVADSSWRALEKRYADAKPIAYGLQFLLVAVLVSATWSWVGTYFLGKSTKEQLAVSSSTSTVEVEQTPEAGIKRNVSRKCQADSDYLYLASLSPAIVMSDLYSTPAALVFSPHTFIAGPYHRNERGILDVMDFFETDTKTARALVDKYQLDYVSFCMNIVGTYPKASVGGGIQKDDLPDWLEEISPKNSPVKVLRVLR